MSTYRSSTAYRNTSQYEASNVAYLGATFYDGSNLAWSIQTQNFSYTAPGSDSIVFDFLPVSTSNPAFVSPSSYNVVFDFTPKGGPQSIGQVVMYEGSHFQADNDLTQLGTIAFYDGSECDVTFQTTVIAYMTAVMSEGSECDSSLATTVVLTGDGDAIAYAGEANVASLTTSPSGPITTGSFPFYDGAEADLATISTSIYFVPTLYDGTECDSSLTICAGCNTIVIDFYDGTEMDWQLQANEQMISTFYEGSENDTALSTFPAWNTANPIFYDGTECDSNLATTSNLTGDGDAINYDGTEMDWQLTINPQWQPSFIFYDGTECDSSLATEIKMVLLAYDGAECDTTFTTNSQWQPSFIFYDGTEYDQSTIAAQQSLPTLIAYEGSEFDFSGSFGNIDNWYFYEGSTLYPNMATQVTLTADGDLVNPSGEELDITVSTFPSGPLASSYVFGAGEQFNSSMLGFPHATFSAVFWQDSYLQTDFSTSTHHFDLARQCAVNQPDSYFYWQNPETNWLSLTNGGTQAIPGALATGFNTYMNLTIAFVERLNPEPMYQGESAGIYDYWPFLEVNGTMGFGMTVLDLKFDLDIPLCYGNFIPDGNSVDAELSQLDDTSCTVDQAQDGSAMSFSLEANIRESTTLYHGDSTWSYLTTETGWYFTFFDGSEMFTASNVTMNPTFYSGEFLTVAFKPITIVFYTGETMNTSTLVTNYTVEFIEVGCLENQYVSSDESQITNTFGPPPTANIELRPYYHQIQAACY